QYGGQQTDPGAARQQREEETVIDRPEAQQRPASEQQRQHGGGGLVAPGAEGVKVWHGLHGSTCGTEGTAWALGYLSAFCGPDSGESAGRCRRRRNPV